MLGRLKEASPRILVVGDLMIDSYLWGKAERISPEAPVPVVVVESKTEMLGGAGNVVRNLLSLGAKVCVAGVIGDDVAGERIMAMLGDIGADSSGLLRDKGRTTSVKTRLMATHSQIVRFDAESVADIGGESEEALLGFVQNRLGEFDAVLLSDYKKGVLTDSLTQAVIGLCKTNALPVLADPKGLDYSKYRGATLLTPNKKEASEATRIYIKDDTSLLQAGMKLKNDFGLTHSVITLSEDGIALFEGGAISKIPTFAREVYDVTGAGDTVLAALGFALACDTPILDACRFANKAAAVVVAKLGSATVTMGEIAAFENSTVGDETDAKIVSRKELSEICAKLRAQGKQIVFTNGCFDILHAGHVRYLSAARRLGDVLVLGLNSDGSVHGLKGEGRPVNGEEDRSVVLASLACVSYVTLFDEPTPLALIEEVKPTVLVKGADYTPQSIVGYDFVTSYGGRVETVALVEGRSTTGIIKKIQKS